jgi:hypothetical protein
MLFAVSAAPVPGATECSCGLPSLLVAVSRHRGADLGMANRKSSY